MFIYGVVWGWPLDWVAIRVDLDLRILAVDLSWVGFDWVEIVLVDRGGFEIRKSCARGVFFKRQRIAAKDCVWLWVENLKLKLFF